jgi:hypothetical protein
MNEKIKQQLEAANAHRVWRTEVPGVRVEVVCYRSEQWRNDKLVLIWPSGDWELFELVPRSQLELSEGREQD